MNRKAISPIVSTVILIGVTLVASVIIYFALVVVPQQTQITSPAPTDYFSLSCQQLKDRINAELNFGDDSPNYNARISGQTLAALLQIYQIKGCQP